MNGMLVRRATVEDLPQLRTLWQMENLSCEFLEKHFTEFQVVDDGAGQVLAAIGLQTGAGHGRLHSEAIAFFDQADAMRALLWPRLKIVASNQRIHRLWTAQEAPFWKEAGFEKANEETLPLRPAAFPEERAPWLTMPLRATDIAPQDVDKQFAELKVISQAETARLMERAKVMKVIAMILMTAVFAAFVVWVIRFVQLQRRRP